MLNPFPVFNRTTQWARSIGTFDRGVAGPIVIAVGGIHGNEPAGLIGIQAVLDFLHNEQPAFRGKLFGLGGNLNALRVGERYVDHDLNRIWVALSDSSAIDSTGLGAEGRELRALRESLQGILAENPGPVVLLDLHTTSAAGCPFMMIDGAQNLEEYKAYFPVPIITGLIDRLRGTLVHFMVQKGHRAVVFEGGQHEKVTTLQNVIAAIWILLVKLGCVDRHDVPGFENFVDRLAVESEGLPEIMDVFYRHAVDKRDQFEMMPGYFNFDPVRRREVLARDIHGPIRAPRDSRLLMPRYQGQGNDGFFLGVETTLEVMAREREMRERTSP